MYHVKAIAGQADVHEEWGGVVPGLARDSHAAKMDDVVEKALRGAGMESAAEVDAVAVTVRLTCCFDILFLRFFAIFV